MLPSFGTSFFLGCILAFFDFAKKNLTIEFIGVFEDVSVPREL